MIYDLIAHSQHNFISNKQHLKEYYRKRFTKTRELKCFLTHSLRPNLIPVLERDPDIILAVDRDVIRETVPKGRLKLSYPLKILELIEESFDCRRLSIAGLFYP